MVDLYARMRSDEPKSRPTSAEALTEVRHIKRTLAPEALQRENLPKFPKRPMPPAVEEHWRQENARTEEEAIAEKLEVARIMQILKEQKESGNQASTRELLENAQSKTEIATVGNLLGRC